MSDEPQEIDVFFDSVPHAKHPEVYIVWGNFQFEHADIRALTTNRDRAEKYKKVVEHENKHRSRKYTSVTIEKNRLNHLYGFGMIRKLHDIELEPELQALIDEEQDEL
jgi:desulfoferrodoxin (superoxide reductase-like protein)